VSSWEGEVVRHVSGWRVRVYAGHTGLLRPRFRRWHSDLGTTGLVLRLWGTRVVGVQRRRA
jgi:hypothetical protein